MFVAAYLRGVELLAENGKVGRATAERQAAFLVALSAEAKARLDRGEYPPYHLVNAARRAAGVPADKAKNWLHAFLYWRSHSLKPGAPSGAEPGAEPGAAADGPRL